MHQQLQGGIIVKDGDGSTQGYLYADGGASTPTFGLLDGTGTWAVKCRSNEYVQLLYDNAAKLQTASGGVTVTGVISATGGNSTNWNTAHGWGNHASAGYVTSSGNTIIGTDSDINTSGAAVLDQLVMTDGVITSHSTRNLTLANLGYTGATNANNYSHPTSAGNKHVPTGGASGQFLKYSSSGTATWATPSYIPNTDTNTTYSVGDGGLTQKNFTTALNTKLGGIETGATADQTAAQILTAIKTVDGSGSGLDADLLDGNHASAFADKYVNLGVASGAAYDTHHWNKTHAAYSNNGSSPSYIVLTTSIPQDNYVMGGFTLILQNHYSDADEGDTLNIYGYWNPESNGGFIGFRYNTSNPECNPTIQVGRNSSGNTVFLISGESGNYATAVAKDMVAAYSSASASSSWGDGWAFSEASSTTGISNINTLTRNGISATNVSNWNTAYSWGNHASAGYVTSSGNTIIGTDSDINTSGAAVLDQLVMTDGVITSHSTRNLTLANLGYTGATNANNYSHPTSAGNKHVPTGGSSGQFLKYSSSGTATWATPSYIPNTDTNTTYSVGDGGLTQKNFTTALNTKLGGIETGATADQTAAQILALIKTVDVNGSSGVNAGTFDGLQLHSGRNNEANKVVRTDSNSYLNTGWINTTSGDIGGAIPSRIYTNNNGSGDAYVRYTDLTSFRSLMNVTAKTTFQGREQVASDSNYWVGTMGWGTVDLNTIYGYGSGHIESWGSPTNAPSTATSHWVGHQSLHYTNGNTSYGHQFMVGAGDPAHCYLRGKWGSTTYSWARMWNSANDGASSGLDADLLDGQHGSYYYAASNPNGYNNYSHPTSAGNKHVPTGGSSGQFLKYSSSGTATWATPSYTTNTNTTYSVGDGGLTQKNFTTTLKSKLDGIAASANNYSLPSNVVTNTNAYNITTRPRFSANQSNNWDTIATASGSQGSLEIYNTGSGNDAFIAFHAGGDYAGYFGLDADTNDLAWGGWSVGASKHRIFHAGNSSQYTSSLNTKLGGIATSANNYSLPAGSSSTRGGFKIGYSESGKNYPVEISSEKMYVNVPWTDTNTDTNTTYSVGDGGLTQKNFTTTLKSKLDGIAASANNYSLPSSVITNTSTSSQLPSSVVTNSSTSSQGYFTSALNTKLSGIETGATADQTAAQILAAIKTVDVNGTSGINAGTLDGAVHYPLAQCCQYSSKTTGKWIHFRRTTSTPQALSPRPATSSGMGRFTGTNGSDTYGRSYTAGAARTLLNVADGANNYVLPTTITGTRNFSGKLSTTGSDTGIGTSNPTELLHVRKAQSTSAATDPFLKLQPTSTTNSTGLTSIFLGCTTASSAYGISLSGWRDPTNSEAFAIKTHSGSANGTDRFVIRKNGYIGMGTSSPSSKLQVVGTLTATTKNFLIDNPKTGGELQYSVIESNEHGVCVRGESDQEEVQLPVEWEWLVHEDSVTVQLTSVGQAQELVRVRS